MGYTVVADLSHDFEAMLDRIRRGEERVTRAGIDEMLKAADALEAAVEEAVSGHKALAAPRERRVRIDLRRLDTLMNLIGELVIARGRLAQLASMHCRPGSRRDGQPRLASDRGPAGRDHDVPHGAGLAGLRPLSAPRARRRAIARQAGRLRGLRQGDRARSIDARRDRRSDRPFACATPSTTGSRAPDVRVAAGKPRGATDAQRHAGPVGRAHSGQRRCGAASTANGCLARRSDTGLVDATATSLTDDEVVRLIARPGFTTAEPRDGPLWPRSRDRRRAGPGAGPRRLGGDSSRAGPGDHGDGPAAAHAGDHAGVAGPAWRARPTRFPMSHVDETVSVEGATLATVRGRPVLVLRDTVMPLLRLRDAVGRRDGRRRRSSTCWSWSPLGATPRSPSTSSRASRTSWSSSSTACGADFLSSAAPRFSGTEPPP